MADGDAILGVISGSAVNQGDSCTPITVPHAGSQQDLYNAALSRAGCPPEDVTYVECHGTGTPVGDPIEFESVRSTFCTPQRSVPMLVGSVKDNIGHCEAASGVAGLLKVLLMLQHRKIPKQANFTRLNPSITASPGDRISVADSTQAWQARHLKAVVNNYGAAGSNAAILVEEEAPSVPATASNGHAPPQVDIEAPYVITGHTKDAVLDYCASLRATISKALLNDRDMGTLSHDLAKRQNPDHPQLWSCTASSASDLAERLLKPQMMTRETADRGRRSLVVLCFPGQNGQSISLSEEIVAANPVFESRLVSPWRGGVYKLSPLTFDCRENVRKPSSAWGCHHSVPGSSTAVRTRISWSYTVRSSRSNMHLQCHGLTEDFAWTL